MNWYNEDFEVWDLAQLTELRKIGKKPNAEKDMVFTVINADGSPYTLPTTRELVEYKPLTKVTERKMNDKEKHLILNIDKDAFKNAFLYLISKRPRDYGMYMI